MVRKQLNSRTPNQKKGTNFSLLFIDQVHVYSVCLCVCACFVFVCVCMFCVHVCVFVCGACTNKQTDLKRKARKCTKMHENVHLHSLGSCLHRLPHTKRKARIINNLERIIDGYSELSTCIDRLDVAFMNEC